jgi:hypothetical protein
MKILIIDIETRPNLAWCWGLWDQNVAINQIEQVGSVISWAAKWYDDKKVMFSSDYHDNHTEMIKGAWDLLDEADVVVGYNSRSFDMKHLNREFVLAGLPPPSPWVDIDLLSVVKQNFKFMSNKLDFVARELKLGSKVQHSGFDLWLGCMRDDPKSWALMKKYNCQDVVLTEKVYKHLMPWIRNHPTRGLYDGNTRNCPRCGHDHMIIRKYHVTKTGKYPVMQCKKCYGYSKMNKAVERTNMTAI